MVADGPRRGRLGMGWAWDGDFFGVFQRLNEFFGVFHPPNLGDLTVKKPSTGDLAMGDEH